MLRYNSLFILIGSLFFIQHITIAQCAVYEIDSPKTDDYIYVDDDDGLDSDGAYKIDINGTIYFTATDGHSGTELWKIDLINGDMFLIKDIFPGRSSSNPANFSELNGKLLFTASDAENGVELWISDGTEDGTYMIKDINPGPTNSNPFNLIRYKSEYYFSATGSQNSGRELWKTDGTAVGTILVVDVSIGPLHSSPESLTVLNDELYFSAYERFTGRELWKTDGSIDGTVLVKDISLGNKYSNPEHLISDGSRIWFSAVGTDLDRGLWVSDGSEMGTYLVKNLSQYGRPINLYDFHIFNSELFFVYNDPLYGLELWKSDGTETGTTIVKDIFLGDQGSIITNIVEFGSMLFFGATDGSGPQLWKSDGTEEGTELVSQLNSMGEQYCEMTELYANDQKMFYSVSDATYGMELWSSDGTAQGTLLEADINPGTGYSLPLNYLTVGDNVYFDANDGIHGHEMWTYNLTTSSLSLIKDLNTSVPRYEYNVYTLNCEDDELYFGYDEDGIVVLDDVEIDLKPIEESLGLKFLESRPIRKLGSKYVMTGIDGSNDKDMYVTDGTIEGTYSLEVNQSNAYPYFRNLSVVGSLLYFNIRNAYWVTDGTIEGTFKLDCPDMPSSGQVDFVELNGFVYFNTVNGIWKTDGLSTVASQVSTGIAFELRLFKGSLIFRNDSPEFGIELWISDGTVQGTTMLKDLYSGELSSIPKYFEPLDSEMFFTTFSTNTGVKLWKTDGTSSGTQLVKDIIEGVPGSEIKELKAVGSTMYFVAEIPSSGAELWQSDGTTLGTVQVMDINEGPGSSNPSSLMSVDGHLYFTAFNGESIDIWSTKGASQGVHKITDKDDFDGFTVYVRQMIACGGNIYFRTQSESHSVYALDCESLECKEIKTNTWDGPEASDWNKTPTYWQRGRLPSICDDVIISAGSDVTVKAGKIAECHTIHVETGASFEVEPTAVFEVQN